MASPAPSSAAATDVSGYRHTHAGGDHCPGTARPFAAQDGTIARVRLAGAALTPAQVRGIGALATRLGDGSIWFTTRANLQVRGLAPESVPAFADGVAALGLLPSASHDTARNVVVSPLAGTEVLRLAADFDAVLCSRPALSRLSGRFLVGIDDGSGQLLALPLDLACQVRDGHVHVALGSDPRAYDAGRLGDPVVPELLAGLCELFLRTAADEEVWNVDDLSAEAADTLHAEVEDILRPVAALVADRRQPRLAGVLDGGWLALTAPLATIPAVGWQALADAAQTLGTTVRVTPWHAVVLPLPAEAPEADDTAALLARLAATGWVVDGSSPWLDIHGCSGREHCARSRSDVQGHARALAGRRPALTMPVMIVGCERRCGHPSVEHVAAVASGPQTYTLSLHDGTHGPQPAPFASAAPDGLADAVATPTPAPEGQQ